jgi:hypothetical protein
VQVGKDKWDYRLPATQTFAFSTQLALHIASAGVQDLKRPAENTLATSQKVGCTTKNRVSSYKHAPFLAHIAYKTPSFPIFYVCHSLVSFMGEALSPIEIIHFFTQSSHPHTQGIHDRNT